MVLSNIVWESGTVTEIETRKRFLINTAYVAILLGLYYLFMEYAFWLLFPFMFALFIAMVLQKPINFIVRKTKVKKPLASGLCVFVLLLVAAGIVALIGVKLVSEIRGLINSLLLYATDFPDFLAKAEVTILNFIQFLPDSIEKSAAASISGFFSKLSSSDGFTFDFEMLSAPLSGVWSTAKMVPEIVVALIISIVACFFMTADYDRLVNFAKRQLPESKREAVSITKRTAVSSVGKLARAYALLMLLTFCEMVVGLNVLRLAGLYEANFLLATAVIVAVVDIVPILGTGTILIPWAIYSLLSGSTGLGIGLLVLYVLIYVIRQAVEPKLVASNLGLPPILTLMGMYIGVKLFGFIGLFLVPLSIMFVKILNDEGIVKLWKNLGNDKERGKVCTPEEPKTDHTDKPVAKETAKQTELDGKKKKS